MFRVINNSTFWLVRKQQRNTAELFYYIKDVYADLYFEINNELGVLHRRGNFVGFQFNNENIVPVAAFKPLTLGRRIVAQNSYADTFGRIIDNI
jgi:hypothetical protein